MWAAARRGAQARAAWSARVAEAPDAAAWAAWQAGPDLSKVQWPDFSDGKAKATRKASGEVVAALVDALPQFRGGSADLSGSNGSKPAVMRPITRDSFDGNYIHFGVREHGMGAVANGMALHGMRPYTATFLVFHDYMRPSVRLAGLMGLPSVYIYTHDSVFLGEDGPTHQPIEQVMSLRLIPNLVTLRPADSQETADAWRVALARDRGPTAICLTRQGVPSLDRAGATGGVAQGAYVLVDAEGPLRVVLMATGSEVSLALAAREALQAQGVGARVVSFPSWALFDAQDRAYRVGVLPPGVPRVSIEAGRTLGWERYTGMGGAQVGIDRFGASAPATALGAALGLTAEAAVEAALGLLD